MNFSAKISCKQSNGKAILGDAAQELRYGNVAYMESGTCTEKLIPHWGSGKYKGMQVSDGQICAKSKPSAKKAVDACQGDSGGPLVYDSVISPVKPLDPYCVLVVSCIFVQKPEYKSDRFFKTNVGNC